MAEPARHAARDACGADVPAGRHARRRARGEQRRPAPASASRGSSSTPSTCCAGRARGWSRRPAGSIGSWTGIGPILSDSGGFQIWSLIRQDPSRGVIRDNEVIFREPSTGEKWNLTPERVVGLQLQLGSATSWSAWTTAPMRTPPSPSRSARVERTVRWARRCRDELDRQVAQRRDAEPPRIFAVVQGGGIEALRRQCAAALAEIGFDGYGFGGWPLAADGDAAGRADALGRRVAAGRARRSMRSASGGRTTSSPHSRWATRSSTAPCRRATRATDACMRSGPAGPTRRPSAGRRLLPRRAHP